VRFVSYSSFGSFFALTDNISNDQKVLIFVALFLVFKCASSYSSFPHLLLQMECCSVVGVPSTDVQTQLPWDNIRALIFYIVPSSFCKFLERRKRGVLLEIGPTSLSYVGPHTSHAACLLTAWSRVLLEKLTSSQLVKEFPVVGNPRIHYCFYKSPQPAPILSTSYGALWENRSSL